MVLLDAFELTGDDMAFPRYPGAFDASTCNVGGFSMNGGNDPLPPPTTCPGWCWE